LNFDAHYQSSTQHLLQRVVTKIHTIYTGRFIMYSGITKLYYRKTVVHVFKKPVQIEGTTTNNFFGVVPYFLKIQGVS
jgi:hypothetical protein